MVRDPVCGAQVDPTVTQVVLRRESREHAFCSWACALLFERQGPGGNQTRRVADPVCGAVLVPLEDLPRMVWGPETFWFCSPACYARFRGSPPVFVEGQLA